ncbi:ABC transporter permease [Chitinophaga sp. XS-30]|uniref:ABC transporter permease n=1 Tax=Chitinophaga sp. XS-30 TaxID=2604421 RepID=UPI0011DCE4E2|nr:ABC transporter permease [Chitinophaga sp. XS-30]QEH40309.1 FtsX-like permease family protein [Chitinophaga sp. XS-30]
MFRNYIKIAWRNIWKAKQISFVNITGLAVATAVALLLCLTVYREFTFDDFHERKKDIYMVYMDEYYPERTSSRANMAHPLAPALQQEIPGIKAVTRYANDGASVRVGEATGDASVHCVDTGFLQIFSFPAVSGRPELGVNDVIITEETALRFFKGQDPVGKSMTLSRGNKWENFRVTAVLKDPPSNSSLEFDMLLRIENGYGYQDNKNEWEHFSLMTFVELMPGVTTESFSKRGKLLLDKYYEEKMRDMKADGAKPGKYGGVMHIGLIPLKDVHFSKTSSLGSANKTMLFMMVFVAGFLLFIAGINFINLTIARAFTRAKEVGMRKMMGAGKVQVALQFCGEALILFIIALVLGILLALVLMPQYNALLNYKLSFSILKEPQVLACLAGVFLLVALLAGGYPALVLARSHTLQILKGKISTGRSNYLRNSLIVTQFVFSSLLICCTLIAWQQMNYLRNKPLGFNTEEVVSIPLGNLPQTPLVVERMRAGLAGQPGIIGVTSADNNYGRGRDGSMSVSFVGFRHKNREVGSNLLTIGYDYVKTMDLQLIAGRDFDRDMRTDSSGVVINERMVAELGEKDIIGYRFRFDEDGKEYHVLGVVKDFHFQSLHKKIEPITMVIAGTPAYVFVKVNPRNLEATMKIIEKAWDKVAPETPFLGSFVNENTNRQYNRDKKLSQIFVSGAVLTIIISCMGLFAIAMLAIGQRTKEIGVRKVLGASVLSITTLISKDFLKLVGIAILIASPLAGWIMNEWLQEFAYNIGISWWVFVVAGLLVLTIAAFTISFQSIRAALTNPVKSLRTE